MKKALLMLLVLAPAVFSQCSDYYAEAQEKAGVCDFNQLDLGKPNVYHCFEAGESYLTTAVCVKASDADPSQYYEKALYYFKNSLPKLSEKGDYPTKARAYEKIAEVYLGQGNIEAAREYYNLSIIEYMQAKEYSNADRVKQLILNLGNSPQQELSGEDIVRPEAENTDLSYYFVGAASISIIALFLLLAFKRMPRTPPETVKVKHPVVSKPKVQEPVKKVKEKKPAKTAKERAKEKLRKKYAASK